MPETSVSTNIVRTLYFPYLVYCCIPILLVSLSIYELDPINSDSGRGGRCPGHHNPNVESHIFTHTWLDRTRKTAAPNSNSYRLLAVVISIVRSLRQFKNDKLFHRPCHKFRCTKVRRLEYTCTGYTCIRTYCHRVIGALLPTQRASRFLPRFQVNLLPQRRWRSKAIGVSEKQIESVSSCKEMPYTIGNLVGVVVPMYQSIIYL